MSDLKRLMFDLWESACADNPLRPSAQVVDGHFVLTIKGNRDNWATVTMLAGVPDCAEQRIDGDMLTCRWPSHADAIFGEGGMLAALLPNYEPRAPQLHMARMVQRSIEMGAPAVIEAGTGTGKSFAYAAIALSMGKRLIVSTSNKNLQMQLYYKDLPFLQQLFPGKRVALAQGKGNFACRERCGGHLGAVLPTPELAQWYATTESGNTEEITFAVERKDLAAITVDDDCTGKHCPSYADCFYYAARANLQGADVIVTNHALLCLDQITGGALLPPCDLVVVDEAHKLADYARNALGAEFTMGQISKALHLAMGLAEPEDMDSAETLSIKFEGALNRYIAGADSPQVGVHGEDVIEHGEALADVLAAIADQVFSPDELPNDGEEKKLQKRADRIRRMADKVRLMALPTPAGYVRWIEPARGDDAMTMCAKPFDVSSFVGALAGVRTEDAPKLADHTRCTRCARTLTAAQVAVLEGKPYGPDCIHYVDVFGDAETMALADWLGIDRDAPAEVTHGSRAIVFCSATLAAPDMAHFLATAGLPDAMQMVAASPFDYAENALLYVPTGSNPAPNEQGWLRWAIDQMRQLVQASRGGAFLLFTSYAAMKEAVYDLRYTFTGLGLSVYVQGELPKLEIARRFREDGNAVLFATKSFFEGVSIDGDALRLVVIDKMPFEAPSPLLQAMEADATERARRAGVKGRRLEMWAFDQVRVPRMIIELKQGAGRLIRTSTDRGTIAILDPRLRSAQYGRQKVLPALPPAMLVGRIEAVQMFYGELKRRPLVEPPLVVAVPERKPAKSRPMAVVPATAVNEEIPF